MLKKLYILDKDNKPIFYVVNDVYKEGKLVFIWIENLPFFFRRNITKHGRQIVIGNYLYNLKNVVRISNKTVLVGVKNGKL